MLSIVRDFYSTGESYSFSAPLISCRGQIHRHDDHWELRMEIFRPSENAIGPCDETLQAIYHRTDSLEAAKDKLAETIRVWQS